MSTPTVVRACRIPGCAKPRLSDRPLCSMHRTRIRRHGDPHIRSLPKEPDVDELDVQIVVRSRRPAPGLTADEKRLAALELSVLEVSAAEIAQVLLVAPRTVHRWRAEHRAALRLVPAPATRKAS